MAPLAGIRVVVLAIYVPGPVAAARLRELGASLTKVEPPDGDPLASHAAEWYGVLHRGVEVVRLDLKERRDRARLDALLARADLLLSSYRLGALARLALSWPELHARFPRLCYVAIIGHAAPEQDRAGHDLTYVAAWGLAAAPELPRTLVADLAGAERAVSAALALLLARERSGEPGYAEVALADAAADFAAPLGYGLTAPDGALGGALPAYALYPARDGWVAVAALEPRFQERLRGELGLATLTREALADAFRARSAEEWEGWARLRDLPIAAVRALPGPR